MVTKLKAVYTLVEQLYTGSQRALAVVALSNEVPTHLAEILRRLAVLPQRIQELQRASARAGAIAALSRAKAFLPELDPADIALLGARPRGRPASPLVLYIRGQGAP